MKTIAIASQKGGSGKSTLCLHLSVLAQERGPTLIIDLDPQSSVSFWHSRREATAPILVQSNAAQLPTVIEAAKREGVAWVFIDTAPHDSSSMAAAMRLSDLVLVPARPSALDLHAIGPTLEMVKTLRKPYAVVLSQTPPKRGFSEPAAISEARAVIEGQGGRVASVSIIAGLAVNEIEPHGAAAKEYRSLWALIENGEITT